MISGLFSNSWYAWQDSNLRPVAPEESGSNSLNLLSLFLPFIYVFSGILPSLEVDPLFCQIDRVLVQFCYSRPPHDACRPHQTLSCHPDSPSLATASHAAATE